ncbi:MAG: MBL fold metallo-hydrolase [Methanothrix sp.]|nr:MBL fold metallo-hydrolase [Methanothrix sp.]
MDQMISQPVPGTRNVTLYPYLRKVDYMSSNSYLLSSPEQISLIDPGSMDSQINLLDEEIRILQEELLRPVFVYLTHVHLDHWYQLTQGNPCKELSKAFLAVQESGAIALETCDPQTTLSGLLERPMSAFPVDIKLLTSLDKTIECESTIDLNGCSFDYSIKSRRIAEDLVLHSQIIPLGKKDKMEIYHTPGHSPDSICIRSGSMLFVGDIFFAPNPGMAGAYGWSQKDLMQSILKILWILENEKILFCGSGHGKLIDAEKARRSLEVMYQDTASLEKLEVISPLWAKRTSEYALDLKSELERTFTIIAGRLAYVSHVLGELDEESKANELDCLLDIQYMDKLFTDFNDFALQLHEGKKMDWDMVHKTGQVVGRLEKLFDKSKLELVLHRPLLDRVSRQLNDYMTTYRGYRPPYFVSCVDVNELINEVLESLQHNRPKDDAIMQAESIEEYLEALTNRIAYLNIFEDMDIKFRPCPRKASARMDRERFAEIMVDILERFAGARLKEIEITAEMIDEWATIGITGRGKCTCHPLSQSKRFFERSLALSGGLLQTSFGENRPSVEIEFFTQF